MKKMNMISAALIVVLAISIGCATPQPPSASSQPQPPVRTQAVPPQPVTAEQPAQTGLDNLAALGEKLEWLRTNAESGETYTLEVRQDETLRLQMLEYPGRSNITLILKGAGAERTISYTGDMLFRIGSGVTLVLDENITLKDRAGAQQPFVTATGAGAILIMNDGAKITDCINGGVYAGQEGTFIMNGGEISGKSGNWRYGMVYVYQKGTFTMNGGKISGIDNNSGYGVYVRGSSFTMNGGTISGNDIGVLLSEDGIFRLVSGAIYGSNETNSALRNSRWALGTDWRLVNGELIPANYTAEYGTIVNGEWRSNGTLRLTTNTPTNTIRAVNGVLQ